MLQDIFNWLLSAGREPALFIISMMPLIELQGAVPLGMAIGMPWYEVLPLCFVGNLLPIPFVMVFGVRILNWLETLRPFKKIAAAYKKKLFEKTDEVTKYAHIGLFLFVAFPFPGTGAWSGAVIATLLKMPVAKAFLSIALGIAATGILMAAGTHGVLSVLALAG